ncbi:hypothetical protein QAD02_010948 [Eretmocerus hayati]|uniref:Uncharacterized protein n=1 Tax=Eretmocerus hayati TaxID=131215 RepID=A0ACC2NY80_9HYME|nr:hypothetical protein QAD02_010948 [Eretmocerus hayati]
MRCCHSSPSYGCTISKAMEKRPVCPGSRFLRSSGLMDLIVNSKEYKSYLLEHNVNCQANNFLVQQNAIENIATCSGKDRCLLFERLSDSISSKEEYDNLRRKLEEASADVSKSKHDLDYLDTQRKKLAKLCEENQKYDRLQKKLARVELRYHYLKFYEIDKRIDQLLDEKFVISNIIDEERKSEESAKSKVEETRKKLERVEEKLKQAEKESSLEIKRIEGIELDLFKRNQEFSRIESDITKVTQKLVQLTEIHKKRKDIILELINEYRKVEDMKKSYENSQSQSISIELQDKQYTNYLELKDQAMRKIAIDIPQFKSLEKELSLLKDDIKYIEEKRETLIRDLNRQRSKCDWIYEKESKVRENIDKVNLELEQISEGIKKFEEKKLNLQGAIADLDIEIQTLNQEIGESKYSIGEEKKAEKKRQVLETLKSHFPGVVGRLKNLIYVLDHQFENAVTKIIGNKADNIVVDSVCTARECIRFLKEKYAGDRHSVIETFLPLDLIRTQSLDRAKRILVKEQEAVLAVEQITVDDSKLTDLLYHHIGDVLICETDDEALRISSEHKINCVSFNGTYYRRDGIFSGGLANLIEKSRGWKVEERQGKKEERDQMIADNKELKKRLEKVRERLDDYGMKKKGLENTMKYLELSLEEVLKFKDENDKKLAELEEKLNIFDADHKLHEKQELLTDKLEEVEKLKTIRNDIEDEIFQGFCASLGINNIRQYEQGGFKEKQEREERIKEYEVHLDQIHSQIEFEKQRETKAPVLKHRKLLEELEDKRDILQKEISDLQELVAQEKSNDIFVALAELENRFNQLTKQLKIDTQELKCIQKNLNEWGSNFGAVDAHIANLQTEKHTLLKNCKVNSIDIPLKNGTLEDVLLKLAAESSTGSESSSPQSEESQIKEKDIEIDYSKLLEKYKDLGDGDLDNHLKDICEELEQLRKELQGIKFDPKAEERLRAIGLKRRESQNDFNQRIEKCSVIKRDFDNIKALRCKQFNDFFEGVSKNISSIFKNLYNDDSAEAHIHLKNPEEPYLDGIQYTCQIPRKRCVPMESLSGGEKTMASLAMLLSLFRVKPAPFLIFDEIDAALDNRSIKRIRKYFSLSKLTTQIIVVSHHELLSSVADGLIGISLSPVTNFSHVIHFDLKNYQGGTDESTLLRFNLESRCESLQNRLV